MRTLTYPEPDMHAHGWMRQVAGLVFQGLQTYGFL